MSDRIRLSRIGIFAFHGVHDEEQRLGQRFFISLDLMLDLKAAGAGDDLDQSVDYGRVVEEVQQLACVQTYRTIEGLAEALAGHCLTTFPRLERITVTVEKPSAPVAAMIENVAVEITRSRNG